MKKTIFISLLHAGSLLLNAQNSFVLKGKLTGADTQTIYLAYKTNGNIFTKDSASATGGNFIFKGNIGLPTEAYLSSGAATRSMDDPNFRAFFLEPANMTVELTEGHFKDANFTGSKTEDENQQLQATIRPVLDRMKPITERLDQAAIAYREAIKAKESEALTDSLKYREAAIRDQYTPLQDEIAKLTYQFFKSHPQSFVTLSQLMFYVGRLPLDSLDNLYAGFSADMKRSPEGKSIHREIEQLRNGSPGSIAKNFAATDINGKLLRLSDFKGKYVLLDFWASWCVPCRKGNPHLKELYSRYHRSGIEFIGVSDDDGKPELWKKAVSKDKLPWRHVLRGLDWDKLRKNIPNNKDIGEKFGIHELPTKILIDRTGRIIGRFDESEEKLDQKLKDIFAS